MIQNLLYTIVGYSLITNNGLCDHVNGGSPTNCVGTGSPSQSDCEGFCSYLTSCVGYSYDSFFNSCFLYPSGTICHPDSILVTNTHTATTANDLVASASAPDSICYRKISGKILK